MNSKEIKEALKIINEPITVNCIEYKYFDEENYNKITNVYENCLWFANNLEQINLTVENLQKENNELLNKKQELIDYLKEEQYRLARETSAVYEDSLGKIKFVNEEIYNEVSKVLSKIEKE